MSRSSKKFQPYDHFEWSGNVMPLEEFAHSCTRHLPVIMLITDGYSGRDEKLHTLCSDEVMWVYKAECRKRFIFRDSRNRFVTLPKASRHAFQVVYSDGSTSVITGQENLSIEQAIMFSGNDPKDRVMFSRNRAISYNHGAEFGCSERLGLLKFQDAYDQVLLWCHPLIDNQLILFQQVIPSYMPVHVDRAVGFRFASRKEFKRYVKKVEKIVSSVEHVKDDISDEILMFDSSPGTDYEDGFELDVHSDESTDSDYENISAPPPPPRKGRKEVVLKGIVACDDNSNDPLWQDRRPTAVDLDYPMPPNEEDENMNGKSSDDKPPPPLLPRSPTRQPNPDSSFSFGPVSPIVSNTASCKNVVVRRPTFLTPAENRAPPPPPPSETPEVTLSPESPSGHPEWAYLADVPLNVSEFTHEEVIQSLGLLGLGSRCGKFVERNVNGRTLMSLDDNSLKEKYGLSPFECHKLKRFCHNGWRPKI